VVSIRSSRYLSKPKIDTGKDTKNTVKAWCQSLVPKAWLPKAWLPKAWLPKAWLPKAWLPKAWLPKDWCQRQGEKQGPNTLL
jgi:hypothetical protein